MYIWIFSETNLTLFLRKKVQGGRQAVGGTYLALRHTNIHSDFHIGLDVVYNIKAKKQIKKI